MADIIVIVKDGLGLGDSSNNTSKSKEVADYINTNDSGELNISTLSKEVTDIIYGVEVNSAEVSSIRSTDDEINLGTNPSTDIYNALNQVDMMAEIVLNDNIDNVINNTISQQSYEDDSINLADSVVQEVTVVINAPTDLSEHFYRDTISFTGTVLKNGSPIADNLIRWSSSVDGIFQEGNSFDYNRLSIGEHSIRMYVDGEKIDNKISLIVKRTKKSERPEDLTEV